MAAEKCLCSLARHLVGCTKISEVGFLFNALGFLCPLSVRRYAEDLLLLLFSYNKRLFSTGLY